MKYDRHEALRYLKMGSAEPDAAFLARFEAVESQVEAAASARAYWRLEPVTDGAVGAWRHSSARLSATLAGCPHAFLFVATLGAGVDALLRRLAVTSQSDQLIADAIANAMIESYCDGCESRLAAEVPGERLRMRFSPGFGDLALDTQRPLLSLLESPKTVGVSLTDALLMTPLKSVSAIIGAGR